MAQLQPQLVYSIINTPCLEYTESAKPSANRPYDDKIIGVDNIKGAMYDSVNNTVMKNHPSITAEGTKTEDNMDSSNDSSTVELDSNGNLDKKDVLEDDPLTIQLYLG